MPACSISPADKRKQARLVGRDLVKNYGKKAYYTPLEIRNANRHVGIPLDFICWSYAMFASHKDFNSYHASIGEACNYVSMKTDMLGSVSTAFETSNFDFNLPWLELPSLDWSAFDLFDLS